MIHKRRTTCRLCHSPDVEVVFALEPSPLAEAYLPPERAHEADQRYPLDVFLCRACGGVQLLDVIDAGHLFRDYGYTSSMSPDLADHFDRYAASVCERFKPGDGLVVDVGSNDGSLLRRFKERGCTVLGVEPAREIAKKATHAGTPTVCNFMNQDTAKDVVDFCGYASIVTANNVLAHAEEPGVILDGVRECLADDGVFVFEVAYLPDQIAGMVFDNFYHEHGVFYSITALDVLLRKHGMELFDAERVPTKGGSIRCFANKTGKSKSARLWTANPAALVVDENASVNNPATYASFLARVNALRDETLRCLREYQSKNLRVAGYGASATTTVLLHHFRCGGFLDYLVDDNQARWGLVSPGYHLLVVSPKVLYRADRPDAVLITAWRYADAIMERHKDYKGVWIQPLPIFKEIAR